MLRERAAQSTNARPGPGLSAAQSGTSRTRSRSALFALTRLNRRHTPSTSHLNYSRYARYADLDALVEVFGQVKADNPERMIRILPTARLAQDFALNHLILIGGAASDAASLFAQDIPLPRA